MNKLFLTVALGAALLTAACVTDSVKPGETASSRRSGTNACYKIDTKTGKCTEYLLQDAGGGGGGAGGGGP